ncbi:putative protease [Campylobacter sputorum subsp. bubulus]|uniref:Putative protease n=1 Tax=Campylobacter sputorum subsp. sputorum TaxID=32024 RepID=A0A381DI66_9BACT|nr:peptidase U32 family protein [Campylobacter sputorum]ASM35436.1 collagenase-like peptidase, U32 family [Campylobacter sputorum aubsp. sputorum RM3237]KAB0582825.1 U32 family peptidase [Campylobacter sputorum subsp. sputorum]QEL05628.1 collagenase-like peptidase, U32 family [Campylobacter sputorum subsp. sputorum]SUX08489.1 putative protease [Campylobacter sputorum subsp. bubulus]SUX10393.1 putative protease [Campylobacter sputorum subsp. sputorum]
MIIPELLSPAGNLSKLKIALEYGADAVYGGISTFSLRSRAGREFDKDSFYEGIKFTHKKGKKFYATMNAFPFNSQLKNLKTYIELLVEMGVDAFIVATPGVISLIKEISNKVEIHLSTQANVMNYLDAKMYYEMGVSRIVAAREMSLKDAVKIREEIPNLEIEIFCHGSMCFAYSGRCLISAVQSGRLSNRGSCANDCRFEYELYAKNKDNSALFRLNEDETGTYIFNSKDLNLASYIENIIKTNSIDSLKIEGRTKSEYYVACATKAYRMAIDDALSGKFDDKKYQNELNTLKSRGFMDGYIVHKPYDRDDSQNFNSNLEDGTKEVHAISEDGEFFKTKGKIKLGNKYEIFMPLGSKLEEVDNEFGKVYLENSAYFVEFKKLISSKGKEFDEIHSGNENEIKLPVKLPKFSFLRKEIDEK